MATTGIASTAKYESLGGYCLLPCWELLWSVPTPRSMFEISSKLWDVGISCGHGASYRHDHKRVCATKKPPGLCEACTAQSQRKPEERISGSVLNTHEAHLHGTYCTMIYNFFVSEPFCNGLKAFNNPLVRQIALCDAWSWFYSSKTTYNRCSSDSLPNMKPVYGMFTTNFRLWASIALW